LQKPKTDRLIIQSGGDKKTLFQLDDGNLKVDDGSQIVDEDGNFVDLEGNIISIGKIEIDYDAIYIYIYPTEVIVIVYGLWNEHANLCGKVFGRSIVQTPTKLVTKILFSMTNRTE